MSVACADYSRHVRNIVYFSDGCHSPEEIRELMKFNFKVNFRCLTN